IIIVGLIGVNAYVLVVSTGIDNRGTPAAFTAAQAFIVEPARVNYLPILSGSSSVDLDAKAAVVYDFQADRNLFQKNINQKLPVASLTKIMTAVVAWEHLNPNEVVTVRPSAVKVDQEKQDLHSQETISVSNLMQLMLIKSSNDAAYALRDHAKIRNIDLVAAMNEKAAELGMINTRFTDPAGLDDEAYSTAADMVKLVRYALRYSAIWNFSREQTAVIVSADGEFSREIKSTNQLLGVLSDIVGGKTGYTDRALGCMILVVAAPNDSSDKIISIILGSRERFTDMKKLVDWARSAYRWE
ncbi:MAG: hypothetical protein A3C88_00290, partial [Candidatus Yanofskybacteria bacterium RIFCSPHIGHO2_02_FULL_50_12]